MNLPPSKRAMTGPRERRAVLYGLYIVGGLLGYVEGLLRPGQSSAPAAGLGGASAWLNLLADIAGVSLFFVPLWLALFRPIRWLRWLVLTVVALMLALTLGSILRDALRGALPLRFDSPAGYFLPAFSCALNIWLLLEMRLSLRGQIAGDN
jgi:hypothetical protein